MRKVLARFAIYVVTMLLASAVVSVQTRDVPSGDQGGGAAVGSMMRLPEKDPYAKLFQPRDLELQVRRALAQTTHATKSEDLLCTMRIIPVDPQLDAELRVELGRDADTKHTIRALPPPCVAKPVR